MNSRLRQCRFQIPLALLGSDNQNAKHVFGTDTKPERFIVEGNLFAFSNAYSRYNAIHLKTLAAVCHIILTRDMITRTFVQPNRFSVGPLRRFSIVGEGG